MKFDDCEGYSQERATMGHFATFAKRLERCKEELVSITSATAQMSLGLYEKVLCWAGIKSKSAGPRPVYCALEGGLWSIKVLPGCLGWARGLRKSDVSPIGA